jgi:hypothetical protein
MEFLLHPNWIDIMLHPEDKGLEICQNCNGYGHILRETEKECKECCGYGLVESKCVPAQMTCPCIE